MNLSGTPPTMKPEHLLETARRAIGRAQFDRARALLDALIENDPTNVEALVLLAEVHGFGGRETAAIAVLKRALQSEPDNPAVLARLSEVYTDQRRLELALKALDRALSLEPEDAELLNRRGHVHSLARRTDQALSDFDAALAAAPEQAALKFEKAMLLLHEKRYEEAWPLFEHRHVLDLNFRHPERVAPWRGEDLDGRRLVAIAEGGYGDNIWAARFIAAVAARGADVYLQTRPALYGLFSHLEGVTGFVVEGDPVDEFDFYCPVLTLPSLLGVRNAADFPPANLHRAEMPEGRLARLMARAQGRFKVGIIWSGSETYANNRHRAAKLETFLPLTEFPEVQLYSLQKGAPRSQLEAAGLGDLVIDADDCDFAETAALVDALDLVIMTDSAVAHIGGALGKPVWLLLDDSPYWYFGREGAETGWYPSVRLFRQRTPGDWTGVMRCVCDALTVLIAEIR